MNDDQKQRLQTFLARWVSQQPYGWVGYRTAEDIAAEWAADAHFQAVQLAGWLQSPDGHVVSEIVTAVLPFPYGPGVQLLADAILMAGSNRRSVQLKALRNAALVGAGVLVTAGIFGSGR